MAVVSRHRRHRRVRRPSPVNPPWARLRACRPGRRAHQPLPPAPATLHPSVARPPLHRRRMRHATGQAPESRLADCCTGTAGEAGREQRAGRPAWSGRRGYSRISDRRTGNGDRGAWRGEHLHARWRPPPSASPCAAGRSRPASLRCWAGRIASESAAAGAAHARGLPRAGGRRRNVHA